MNTLPATGTTIARGTDLFGNDLVTAAVTMTAEAWDKLTAGYIGYYRWASGRTSAPDMTLEERMEIFLQHEVLVWEADQPCAGPFDTDLDDDVPF